MIAADLAEDAANDTALVHIATERRLLGFVVVANEIPRGSPQPAP